LWVPVESGDNGYVLISALNLKNGALESQVEFPFLASVTGTVTLMKDDKFNRHEALRLERGMEITVLDEGAWFTTFETYFTVLYSNDTYLIWNEGKENFDFIRPIPDPADQPAEFKRAMPIDAVVTENIDYYVWNSSGRTNTMVSIPAGTKVKVTAVWGLRAQVSYNGDDRVYIHWNYLKPAD
jgi:hypothetical protein